MGMFVIFGAFAALAATFGFNGTGTFFGLTAILYLVSNVEDNIMRHIDRKGV